MFKRMLLATVACLALVPAAKADARNPAVTTTVTARAQHVQDMRVAQANPSLYGRRRQREVAPLTSNARPMDPNRATTIRRQMFPQRGGVGVQQQQGGGVVQQQGAGGPRRLTTPEQLLRHQQFLLQEQIRAEERRRLGYDRGLGRLFQGDPGTIGYGSAPTSRGKVVVAPNSKKRRR